MSPQGLLVPAGTLGSHNYIARCVQVTSAQDGDVPFLQTILYDFKTLLLQNDEQRLCFVPFMSGKLNQYINCNCTTLVFCRLNLVLL